MHAWGFRHGEVSSEACSRVRPSLNLLLSSGNKETVCSRKSRLQPSSEFQLTLFRDC